MSAPIELPMAIVDCDLDEAALQAQVTRYHELGARAVVRRRSALELTAQFATEPDPELLRTTIETERECCTFFTLDYAPGDRRLTVAVSDAARAGALDQLQAALTTPA
ncbi:MAG TPA: hypothetical protein VHW96_08520 [Solirubrobacteraceae bacterium]|nr:hypothetical protein [Solirubrobacteraceae bacterium]